MASEITTLLQLASQEAVEMKQHWRFLWQMFLSALEKDKPYLLVPKNVGDDLGNTAMECIALRFCVIIAGNVEIQYNSQLDAYQIGPKKNLPKSASVRVLFVVSYDLQAMKFPGGLQKCLGTDGTALITFETGALPVNIASDPNHPRGSRAPNCFVLFRSELYQITTYQFGAIDWKGFTEIASEKWMTAGPKFTLYYRQRAYVRRMAKLSCEHDLTDILISKLPARCRPLPLAVEYSE